MLWDLLFYIIITVLGASLLHSLRLVSIGIYYINCLLNSINIRIEGDRSRNNYLLIIGPSGSGKTTLFYKIKNDKMVNTTTSIAPGIIKVNDKYLIDIPGNRRIINEYVLKYLNSSISTIIVIDSSDKSSFKDAAEIIYSLLSNIVIRCSNHGSIDIGEIYKVLVLCNKSDITSSRSISYIKDELERGIDRILASQNYTIGNNLYNLIENGEPFSFENIHFMSLRFLRLSLRNSFDDINNQIYSFLNNSITSMGWETDKLIIELSASIDKYGVGLQITKSLREFGVSCSASNNLRSDNLIISSSQKPNKNKIPHCKIYPKFEYQSHLDKIRWTSLEENSEVLANNVISLIVVLFMTIDVYDEIARMPRSNFESYFGHEVIDLVFFEAKQFSSYMRTRCIVIWVGTRDCLSQESLLSNNDGFLSGSEKGKINDTRQRHIDGSCLDRCITNLLVNYSVDSFEAKNELEASQYLISIVSGLHDIQNRPVSSKYRPKNVSGANINPWITQIMQIPGLSEDSARGLESVFKTPKELVRYVRDNLTGKGLVFSKSRLTYMRCCGLSSLLEIEQSPWFKKLTNIHYFCTKGFCTRKLGKSRARKLVILYGNISQPSKMISDQIL